MKNYFLILFAFTLSVLIVNAQQTPNLPLNSYGVWLSALTFLVKIATSPSCKTLYGDFKKEYADHKHHI
jgi:hypothetical protein